MRLTGNDYDRIFRVEKLGQSISPPKYQFLTDDELRQAELKAEQTAKTLLQMPPVMNERQTDTTILDSDVALSGYDSAKVNLFYYKFPPYIYTKYFCTLTKISGINRPNFLCF